MWLLWSAAAFVALSVDPAHSNAGLVSTSFNNELRSGFTRLLSRNGIEQPIQSSYILLNPTDFQSAVDPLIQQRPVPFSPLASTGFQVPRPRYELESLSWVIPYYYAPTRYHPPRGGKKPNDVLVVVVKTKSNCTAATPGNGTKPTDDGNDDDDDDDDDDDNNKGPNPDDEVESVAIVTGGTENGKEPSRCVWAILSCCAPANTPIRYTCFDVLGCSTAFWDTNPCVPAIVKTALDQATMYYAPTTNGTKTTDVPPTTQAPAASNTVAMDLMAALTAGTSTTVAAAPIVVQTPPATLAATAT